MTNPADNADKQLNAIVSALSESLATASGEQLAKELRAAGVDPLKAIEVMKFAEEKAREKHFQNVRDRVAQARKDSLQKMNGVSVHLPPTRQGRIELLRTTLAQHCDTAQFREFSDPENLSDAEIASMLKNLAALGCLKTPERDGP